jgi:hypothetical protein
MQIMSTCIANQPVLDCPSSTKASRKNRGAYQSVNPFNGTTLKTFEELTDKQLDTAMETAATCFEAWHQGLRIRTRTFQHGHSGVREQEAGSRCSD